MTESSAASARAESHATDLLWRLIRYVKPYRRMLVVVFLFAAVFSGGRFGRALLLQPLIDDVLIPVQTDARAAERERERSASAISDLLPETPPAPSSDVGLDPAREEAASSTDAVLLQLLIAALLIVLIVPLAHFGRTYLMHWVMGHVSMDQKDELAAKLLNVPLAYHRAGTSADILTRAVADQQAAEKALRMIIDEFLLAFVMVASGIATLVYISWQLSLIALVTAPLIVGVLAYFSGKIRRGSRKRQEQLGEVVQRLTGILSGIKVIKAFRGEELETRAFSEETRKLFVRIMKVVKNRVAARSLVEFLNNGTGIAVLLIGVWLVNRGYWSLTAGELTAFSLALATTYKPTKVLSRGWAQLMDAMASTERFFEVLDSQEEPADPPDAVHIDGVRESIRFCNVSFSYDRQPVLRGVDLEVPRGEVIAVVGPTGGGKTTLVDLLLRFHDVEGGAIEIDGVDLRQIARRSLLDQAAVVTQEPFLFDTSILENIRYGRPDATQAEIDEAARAAHVDEFVGQLPDGYETQVGEFGLRLSGGQRQRITIARAMLKNGSILVFDEATSSLDAKTERTVQEAIDAFRGKQTIFIVAHRLSTIRHADRIVVIENGRVSQLGSHEELIAQEGGLYRELASIQTEGADEVAPPAVDRS